MNKQLKTIIDSLSSSLSSTESALEESTASINDLSDIMDKINVSSYNYIVAYDDYMYNSETKDATIIKDKLKNIIVRVSKNEV